MLPEYVATVAFLLDIPQRMGKQKKLAAENRSSRYSDPTALVRGLYHDVAPKLIHRPYRT
jgi:hypothetical protein